MLLGEDRCSRASMVPGCPLSSRNLRSLTRIQTSKSVQAKSKSRPLLDLISFDVAALIATELYANRDYSSLCSLARTSKFFASVAHAHIYREINLDFDNWKCFNAVVLLERLRTHKTAVMGQILPYVQNLNFIVPQEESAIKNGQIHRLAAIAIDLLGTLTNIRHFGWASPIRMPQSLMHCLSQLQSNQPLQVSVTASTKGLNEDHKYLRKLCSMANLTNVTINLDFRRYQNGNTWQTPRCNLRLRDNRYLTSLVLNMNDTSMVPCTFSLTNSANAPLLVRHLELTGFSLSGLDEDVSANTRPIVLQSLRLIKCKGVDALLKDLTRQKIKLSELRIDSPIWKEGTVNQTRQHRVLLDFLSGQSDLKVLELVYIGITDVFSVAPISLTEAHLRNSQTLFCTSRPQCAPGRTPAFRSLGLAKAQGFISSHPNLKHLSFDLDLHNSSLLDGKFPLQPLNSLSSLTIFTLTDLQTRRPLTLQQVKVIAKVLLGPTISSLEVVERFTKADGSVGAVDCCDRGEQTLRVTENGTQFHVLNETRRQLQEQVIRYCRQSDQVIKPPRTIGGLKTCVDNLRAQLAAEGLKALELLMTEETELHDE